MNAAAKYINQGNLFHGHLADIRVSSLGILQISLIVALLLSSLAVINVANIYRTTFDQLESAEGKARQLELKWGALLLEQASLVSPYRVEKIATEKLGMVFVDTNNTHIISTE